MSVKSKESIFNRADLGIIVLCSIMLFFYILLIGWLIVHPIGAIAAEEKTPEEIVSILCSQKGMSIHTTIWMNEYSCITDDKEVRTYVYK